MLNYNPEKIGMPVKTYLYTSIDGKEYNLSSIKDAPYFRTTSMMPGLKAYCLTNWMKMYAM